MIKFQLQMIVVETHFHILPIIHESSFLFSWNFDIALESLHFTNKSIESF